MGHHRGSDTPTSPRAVLHHTDANLCTILHTTVCGQEEGARGSVEIPFRVT